MGWCSGTVIFDDMCDALLGPRKDKADKKAVLSRLIGSLEDMDWDCQFDSDYIDHPLVREVFKELHPDMFEEN